MSKESKKIIGVTVGTTMNPKKIAEKFESGTSLPMVTEQDNGKILKVDGGKWSSADDCKPLTNLEIEELLKIYI